MVICDLVQAYTDRSGGIRTYIDAKRRHLALHTPHRHVLVIPGRRDEVEQNARGIVYRVAAPPVPGFPPYRMILDREKVLAILRRERPELIELGSPFVLPDPAFRYRREHPCAIAGFYHTDVPGAYVRPVADRILGARTGREVQRLAVAWIRRLYRRCDLTLVSSRHFSRQLAALGVRRVELVPLGVDTESFHPRWREPDLRRELGVPHGGRFLIYAGRLDDEKRVLVLVEAFRRLRMREEFRETHLVLVGNGPLRPRLLEAAAEIGQLHVLPYLSERAALARHLASADLYVTAGPHETFGLSVLEAQACGLPVIGVRAGALIERVPEGTGRLGPVDDPAAMAANIAAVLGGPREAMGTAARSLVESRFSWKRTFDQLVPTYESLVPGGVAANVAGRDPGRALRPDSGRVSGACKRRTPGRLPGAGPAGDCEPSRSAPPHRSRGWRVSRLWGETWDGRFGRLLTIVAIGLLVDLLIVRWSAGRTGFAALHGIDARWILLATVVTFVPWITNTLRVMIWTRFFGVRSGFRSSLRIVLATDLTAAATPTAVGGSPAKVALLTQAGLRPGAALLLCGIGSFEDAVFFIVALPVAAAFAAGGGAALSSVPAIAELLSTVRAGLSTVGSPGGVATLGAAAIVWMGMKSVTSRGSRARGHGGMVATRRTEPADRTRASARESADGSWPGRGSGRRLRPWLDRLRGSTIQLAAQMREAAGLLFHAGRRRFLLTLPLVSVQWIARYSVLTILARALGLPLDPFLAFLLQWLVFTVMAVTPTPGALGGAEAAFLAAYRGLVPAGLMGSALGGWRALTFYLPMAAAAVVYLLLQRSRDGDAAIPGPAAWPASSHPNDAVGRDRAVGSLQPQPRAAGSR